MMTLTTKARYAARIMVCLARRGENGPVSRYEIGDAEGISPDYVEQILTMLRAKGLVRSHRGRKGGFSLVRDPEKITLAEVLEAVEGPITLAPCIGGTCDRESDCPSCGVWREAAEKMNRFFGDTTIGKMARSNEDAEKLQPIMYQI